MLPRKKSVNELTPNMLSRLSVFEQCADAGEGDARGRGASLEDPRTRGLRRLNRDVGHAGRKERYRLDSGSSSGRPIREESLERRRSARIEDLDDLRDLESKTDPEQSQPQKSIGIKVFDYLVRRFSNTEDAVSKDASALRSDDGSELDSRNSERDDDVLSIEDHLSSMADDKHSQMLDSGSFETQDYFYGESGSEVFALNDERVSLIDATETPEPTELDGKTFGSEIFGFVRKLGINDIEQMSNTDTESELIDFEDDDDVISKTTKIPSYYEKNLRQNEKETETAKRLAIIQDVNGRILPTIEIEEFDNAQPVIQTKILSHRQTKKSPKSKGFLNFLFRSRKAESESPPATVVQSDESLDLERPSSKAEEAVRDFLSESNISDPLTQDSETGVGKSPGGPSIVENDGQDLEEESVSASNTSEDEGVRSNEDSLVMRLFSWTFRRTSKTTSEDDQNITNGQEASDQQSVSPVLPTNSEEMDEMLETEEVELLDQELENVAQISENNGDLLEQKMYTDSDLVILVMSILLALYILSL